MLVTVFNDIVVEVTATVFVVIREVVDSDVIVVVVVEDEAEAGRLSSEALVRIVPSLQVHEMTYTLVLWTLHD